LALTEDLNLVVISFREETDKHNSMMAEIWMSVLKPCEQEMSKYRQGTARTLHTPTKFVQKALLGSLEFSGVVKARIEEMYPDMPIYEVYNVVTSVCEDPDIITGDVIRTTWLVTAISIPSIFNTFVITTTIRTRPCPHLS
jgi:hypothetical protein